MSLAHKHKYNALQFKSNILTIQHAKTPQSQYTELDQLLNRDYV